MTKFRFIQLDPRKGTEQFSPEEWARTLGIEVTVPVLAGLCGLGNVDPQHGEHRSPPRERTDASTCDACGYHNGHASDCAPWPPTQHGDAAVSYATRMPLPADDATLATVRPDVDSIAAMAVLMLRRFDLVTWPHVEVDARVNLITARDAFIPGGDWKSRSLPTVAKPWPATHAPVSETESLAPLGVICSPSRDQEQRPLAERVALVACWLLWGEPDGVNGGCDAGLQWGWRHASTESACEKILAVCGVEAGMSAFESDYTAWCANRLVDAAAIAKKARLALARAVESGEVKIRVSLGHAPAGGSYTEGNGLIVSLVEYENDFSYMGEHARIAVVESAHIGAVGLGYCVAPVVVATMPPGADGAWKMTIAAWKPGLVDFHALREALNMAEIGDVRANPWGGGATILGSPQGSGTRLDIEAVVRLVVQHMLT